MDNQERKQFVDELLDASLARYGSVTPRPGLEARVLAQARAKDDRSSWFLWAGWLAAGSAAVVIAAGVFNLAHRRLRPAPATLVVELNQPKPAAIMPRGLLTGPKKQSLTSRPSAFQLVHRIPRTAVEHATRERQTTVFPSPRPLTEEEKLLVQYVRETPALVLSASLTESTMIPDLEIKTLEISPPDMGENEIWKN